MIQKDNILIIAPEEDIHAQAIAHVLRSQFGAQVFIWDSSRFPANDPTTFRLGANGTSFWIKSLDGCISVDSLRSVWWRRSTKFKISDSVSDPQVHNFCLRECDAFFKGALSALNIPIINDPNNEIAARKPLQLQVARKLGIIIPETIMSSDPQEIRAFWKTYSGKCIYKAFTSPSWRMADTRLLSEVDLEDLETLRHAPIIVQEKIEKLHDVRVTIFGEKIFAASVHTNLPQAELDWRLDLTASWEKHEIPEDLGQKLVHLLHLLGLQYGCFDLRQSPDGSYVFFEVNPSGQFLFIEIDTNQRLIQACAELLWYPQFSTQEVYQS